MAALVKGGYGWMSENRTHWSYSCHLQLPPAISPSGRGPSESQDGPWKQAINCGAVQEPEGHVLLSTAELSDAGMSWPSAPWDTYYSVTHM